MTSSLPRRPFLGLAVRAHGGGLEVTQVLEGATGAAAGLEEGDVIEQVDGAALTAAYQLTAALRGEPARLRVRRGAGVRELDVAAVPMPSEQIPGLRYGHVCVAGERWRTIEAGLGAKRGPAVLYIAGIATGSLDFARREVEPIATFFRALAERGVRTLRLERRGAGDSEGGPPEELSFEAELEGYRAALGHLRSEPSVLGVLGFGHSVGGVLAPLLDLDGYALYGSSARPWSECVRESIERQRALLGQPPLEHFEARAYGRTPGYHEALDRLRSADLWRARRGASTTVIAGEYDVVVSPEEQLALAALTGAVHVVVPRLDHAFSEHESVDDALRSLGRGRASSRLVDCVVDAVARLR